MFTPNYHPKTKQYECHLTPTGARVVPADTLGKRIIYGWEFYYQDWKGNPFDHQTYSRTGAKFGDLKPDSRKGCSDVDMLRKHGLNTEWMHTDPMFFFNCCSLLVLPLTRAWMMIIGCHTFQTHLCVLICMQCGRVRVAGMAMTLLLSQFQNWFTGLLYQSVMVLWIEDP